MARATGLVLTLVVLSGCAADSTKPWLSENHPAHANAASTPLPRWSGTLDIAEQGRPGKDRSDAEGERRALRDRAGGGHASHDPVEPAQAVHPVPAGFAAQVGELLRAYFNVAGALAEDDVEQAHEAMERMQARLADVDAQLLDETQRKRWEQIRKPLSEGIDHFLAGSGIEPARIAFEPVSEQLEKAVRQFGSGGVASVHVMHCPMAFDNRGADWLQPEAQVSNPYYGARMLRCGAVTETIVGGDDGAPGRSQEHDHH